MNITADNEEQEFIKAVKEYNDLCDKLEYLVIYEISEYKRLTLSDLAYEATENVKKATWLIEDAKHLVKKYHIADNSRLVELEKRL